MCKCVLLNLPQCLPSSPSLAPSITNEPSEGGCGCVGVDAGVDVDVGAGGSYGS